MSHAARRRLAPAPDAIAERVASAVGTAFQRWADRFVGAVEAELLPGRFVQDATVQGLFEEAGRAAPSADVLAQAFKMLDRQSSDNLRVAGVPANEIGVERGRQADFVRQNTDLIRAQADLRRRVERVIADPLNEGRSVADIAKMLQEQAGYSRSRAELTARDQTLKLYGQIQEDRQRAAGVTKYIWTTSLDERVREDHARLDGTVQEWDDPPVVDQRTGRRAHPGGDFQCRCSAVPVLDDDVEPTGTNEPPPREPAMQPTLEEVRAEEARAAAAAAQMRAELEAQAAADRRIAEARRAAELERLRATEAEHRAAAAARRATAPRLADVAASVQASSVPATWQESAARELTRAIPPNAAKLTELELGTRPTVGGNGTYNPGRRKVFAGVPDDLVKNYAPLDSAVGSFSTAYTTKDAERSMLNTLVHEYGHHVHLTATNPEVDQLIAGAYKRAVTDHRRPGSNTPPAEQLRGAAPTRYARHNHREFWAESFSLYHTNPGWLRDNAPIAYKMVVDVLRVYR